MIEIKEEEVRAFFRREGWPDWDSIEIDHLRPDERSVLEAAIGAGKAFVEEVRRSMGHPNQKRPRYGRCSGMILLSAAVDGDPERTGYGCGKTLLAKIIYYLGGSNTTNDIPGWEPEYKITKESKFKVIQDLAQFWPARDFMSIFDEKEKKFEDYVKGRRLFVIDDVGREGALRWEKRDLAAQLFEKQSRYYALIDFCYQHNRSLVLTTNFTAAQLAAFLGGASWSRLTHMVQPAFRVNLTGVRDFRPILARRQTAGDNLGDDEA